jgi:hypothetical protein
MLRRVTGGPHLADVPAQLSAERYSMHIGVITNPNSRKNKNRPDRAQRLQSIVGAMGEVHETESLDSIKPVLREFLR